MTANDLTLDQKPPSALKHVVSVGLYGFIIALGAVGGLMALLLVA